MTKDFSERARSVSQFSRNTLVLHLRFMDTTISRLEWPAACVTAPGLCPSAFRCFAHGTQQDLWNLASDMAVEGVINRLHISAVKTMQEPEQQKVLQRFAPKVNNLLTAEKIYAFLRTSPPAASEIERLRKLFSPDDHRLWYADSLTHQLRMQSGSDFSQASVQKQSESAGNGSGESNVADEADENAPSASNALAEQALLADWKEISESIQMDLETFSKHQGDAAGNMMQNLCAANREKVDYTAFLKKFAVMGEVMRINDDEFDYVFYTYGMKLFPEKRMPLIEPLEYKDVKRIREFVIDT